MIQKWPSLPLECQRRDDEIFVEAAEQEKNGLLTYSKTID